MPGGYRPAMAWVVWGVVALVLVAGLALAWRHDRAAARRQARLLDPGRGVREARRDLRANPEINRMGGRGW